MTKSVCAVHSSSLCFKDLCKTVDDVDVLVQKLSGLSTYFHTSAARTTELEKIAKDNDLKVCRLPKLIEVRWAEFTFSLLNAVLSSWRALLLFCEGCTNKDDRQVKGFGKTLSNKNNMLLMCFLADFLFLLQNFQKRLQSDSLTLLDVKPETNRFIEKVRGLQSKPLLGGWESAFNEDFDSIGNTFHGHVLFEKERRSKKRNLFVSEERSFVAIRVECIDAMITFMSQRLHLDESFIEEIRSFCNFEATDEQLTKVHKAIAPDIDIASIADQYDDLRRSGLAVGKLATDTLKAICVLSNQNAGMYSELSIILSRLLVCKPHSADCERAISVYSRIKTASRISLSRESLSNYLYVNMNMPPLTKFDPRPAVNRFLTMKKRRNREAIKADKQEWFKRVFDCNASTDLDVDDWSNSSRSASANTKTVLATEVKRTSIMRRF